MNSVAEQGVVAGVLVVIGLVLKRAVSDEILANRFIPIVLLTIGTPLYAAIAGDWSVLSLCTGLISSASAIGFHQAAQQTSGKNL